VRTFWQGLGFRERVTLSGGTVIVVLILVFVFVWQPWQQHISQLRISVPDKQQTLTWMKREAATVNPLLAKRRQATQTESIPVLTVIEETARAANLRNVIRRVQPAPDNNVRVWLSGADFDTWLKWVELLRTRGVEVSAAVINRSERNTVSIRVVFRRA